MTRQGYSAILSATAPNESLAGSMREPSRSLFTQGTATTNKGRNKNMNTKEAVTFSKVRTISGVAGLSAVDSRINVTVEGKFEVVEDARLLIEAAPDLLAALQELVSDKYLSDPINADRMKNAEAAISKAVKE